MRLQSLLGQHTVLASDMMRARVRRDPDFAQAAEVALTRNTQALTSWSAPCSAATPAGSSRDWWAQHVTQLTRTPTQPPAGRRRRAPKDQARRQLTTPSSSSADLLVADRTGASTPRPPAQQITMHVDGLLAQADAYAEKDYAARRRRL